MIGRKLGVLLALATGAACSGDGPNTPPAPVYSLTIHGGDDQQGPAGSVLAQPLQVTVKNPANETVRGVTVRFRVTAGTGAQLSDTVVTSDFDGIARVTARLGPTPGAYEFLALVPQPEPAMVPFSATATAPPTLTSVSPTSFTAGDTLTLRGTDFNTSLAGNVVFIGGLRALIVSGDADSLAVVAPPCVSPGAVAVTVRVGTVTTNAVNATFVASTEPLALDELEGITVTGAEIPGCLEVPGGGAKYLIVPSFASVDTGPAQISYTLGGTASAPPLARASASVVSGGINSAGRFHRWLREQEHQLAPTGQAGSRAVEAESRPLEALTLNSTRRFRVLGDLEGTSFKTATARLRYVGGNVLVYVDVNAPSGGFSDADLASFGALFDQTLYEVAVRAFGSESDVDRNGRVIVLLSPLINALTPRADCGSGFITGYFFGYDLVSTSTNSNKGEIFYALVPDPDAVHSCAHSLAQVKSIVPSTFIHEFQHMISFNQHVLVRGSSDEDVWLNEALSHMAEELASKHYEDKCPPPSCRSNPAQLFPDSSSQFINGNLFDAYYYMRRTDTVSVTTFHDFGNLPERGAAWLFLRWLGDHKGDEIFGRLVQTSKTSILNIEDKAGESFAALFGDFAISLWTDSIVGVPRTSVPERYRFTTRNLRQIFQRFHDLNAVPDPYPLTPQAFSAGSPVTSSMLAGTMKHYMMTTPLTSTTVSFQFAPPAGGQFPPALQAQLGVFRLPIP